MIASLVAPGNKTLRERSWIWPTLSPALLQNFLPISVFWTLQPIALGVVSSDLDSAVKPATW